MAANRIATLVAHLTGDNSGFKTMLGESERSLNSFEAKARTSARRAGQAFDSIGLSWRNTAATIAAVGVSVSVAGLVNDAARFEQQLNVIRATSGATQAQMRGLERSIIQVGSSFRIGLQGSARAAQELQKSGVSIADVTDGALESAVTLAQALGGDFTDSASVAATAMQVFKKDAEDLDAVVQGVTGTVLGGRFELADYALALQQGGGAAQAAGVSLEDFNAALLLVQRNIGSSGSDTGTAFRTFLSRLTPQSEEAAGAMRRLGLEFYDQQGRFVGLAESAERIRLSFAGLSQEQRNLDFNQIFGVDAMRVAIALYNEGADGVAHYRTEVQSAANAAEIAHARTQGFAGATANLKTSFDELGHAIAESGIMDLLTQLTNWAAGGVRAGAQRTRDFSTGLDAIMQNGQPFDPLTLRINREANRRSWDSGQTYAQEREAILRDAQFIRDLLDRPVAREDVYFGDPRGRTYGDTALGQRVRERMDPTASFDNYVMPDHVYVDGQRQFNPGFLNPPRQPMTPLPDPVSASAAASALRDANQAWEDENERQFWLADIERNLGAWGKEHGATIQGLKVDVEGLFTETDRLKSIAEDFAQDVNGTLRSEFIENGLDMDWDNVGESFARSFRAALWDAFFGNTMQSWATRLAQGVAGLLNGVQSTAAGAQGGSGLVGWVDRLLGFPSSGGGKTGGLVEGESGGWLGSVLSGVGDLFGGFFADGGFLGPGQWGIAGENGPEPIFGGTTGVSVIPAHAMAGAGTTNVTNIQIDARGAGQDIEARLRIAVEEASAIGAARGASLKAMQDRRRASL